MGVSKMGYQSTCDICNQPVDHVPEMTYVLQDGGLKMDIKLGIHQYFNGIVCHNCFRKLLRDIADTGILTHRRITFPETRPISVEPMSAEVKTYGLFRK